MTGREIRGPLIPTMAGIQLLYIFNTGGDGLAKGPYKRRSPHVDYWSFDV